MQLTDACATDADDNLVVATMRMRQDDEVLYEIVQGISRKCMRSQFYDRYNVAFVVCQGIYEIQRAASWSGCFLGRIIILFVQIARC